MSEEPNATTEVTTTDTTQAGEVQQPRAVAVRERLITKNPVAIWDTAELEHMGRVGVIMADSGLMSETFTKDGDRLLERPAVIARCVMVANLAREVGANPLMFLQACSIISRKLHIEGKAVNAIIRARTGVELSYEFGLWDTDHFVSVEDRAELHDAGDRLAIRAYDPARPEREVSGSVGMWKTTRNGSPWSNPGNYRRQLRYRSAPEWARAYEPGAILGIYSDADEDLDGFSDEPAAPGRRTRRNLAEKLTGAPVSEGAASDTGFDRAHVAAETGEQTQDAEFEDAGASTQDDGEGGAENSQEGGEAQSEADATTEVVNPGHAKPGEVYFMADTPELQNGKRISFKDGGRFSTSKDRGQYPTFTEHAPEPVADDQPADGDARPTSTEAPSASDGAPSAETEPTSPGSATDAPTVSETATSGPPATDAPTSDGAPGIRENPEDRQDPAQQTQAATIHPPGEGFLASLRPMISWLQIKPAFAAMNRTTDWVQAPDADKDDVRRMVWAEVERVRADHNDPVDQAEDATALALWMTTQEGPEGADAIEGTYRAFVRSNDQKAADKRLKPETMATLETRVMARVKHLRGR